MNKITCEICGTQYDENAKSCPVCGWSHNGAAVSADSVRLDVNDFQAELNELAGEEEAVTPVKKKAKNKAVFDYDAVNNGPGSQTTETEGDLDDDDEEDEEEESGSNPVLVVILVVMIIALLLASAYIFWRFYLPNKAQKETEPSTQTITEEVEQPTETEELTVPCLGLSLVSGMDKLSSEGQNWLLHIKVTPEDTTDVLTFVSEDESVVTVNEEGRVTAVGEGETRIVISCGDQKIECPAIVSYQEETETTEATQSLLEAATEPSAEPEQAATESAQTSSGSSVELKLKKHDLSSNRLGVSFTLELDCDLTADQVEWVSLNPNVAFVDKNGQVTTMGRGQTAIIVRYSGQEDTCIIRVTK